MSGMKSEEVPQEISVEVSGMMYGKKPGEVPEVMPEVMHGMKSGMIPEKKPGEVPGKVLGKMDVKVSIIGASIVDVYAAPVDKELFKKGSVPAGKIEMSFGGDALNEAAVLSGLGCEVELISLLGKDEAGERVMGCVKRNHILSDKITVSDDVRTGVNIVLVDDEGERSFITDPGGSLRLLAKEHILPHVSDMGKIVSFGSIFVSPKLGISEMEEVLKAVKADGERVLVADMTTAKNGEKIKDLAPVLKYIDYIIPNMREAEILTGEKEVERAADKFIENGAKCVVIKCGKDGCYFKRVVDDNAENIDRAGIVRNVVNNENAVNIENDKGAENADIVVTYESGMIPGFAANVVDTTGAGDGFVAGFIYALSAGLEIRDCCRFANAVASLIVEEYGTQGIIDGADKVLARLENP